MVHPTFHAVFAALVVLPLSMAAAILPRGDAEVLYLSNCNGPSGLSSQVAYYGNPGSGLGSPDAVATAPSSNGATTLWEGSTVTTNFADGNFFTVVNLVHGVAIGSIAGSGQNRYTSFTCYRAEYRTIYTRDGNTCSALYSCSHAAPTAKLNIDYAINSQMIEIPLSLSKPVLPFDIVSKVWQARKAGLCDLSPITIGNTGCAIKFDCKGIDGNWVATNAMARHLIDQVIQIVQTKETRSTVVKPARCHGRLEDRECEDAVMAAKDFYSMPAEAEISITNPAAGLDVGTLHYQFSCPVAGKYNCQNEFAWGVALGGLALIPEVGIIFGALGLVTKTVFHAVNGC